VRRQRPAVARRHAVQPLAPAPAARFIVEHALGTEQAIDAVGLLGPNDVTSQLRRDSSSETKMASRSGADAGRIAKDVIIARHWSLLA
jgi:hypothetical protein